eukprot:CAMPEP_0178474686 /NCGR_PEP_ID=MMETSP0696-20121128/2728_1 /TAXON_ID=265572 /ORGANISM="Extubocellulus spinifer, Strain CCMP396" /LENGTH=1086 /DNA_ID=CAMNT_0020101943 /DNA_START=333 /DNA_END=3593 /DNA_ORIENTATION=-
MGRNHTPSCQSTDNRSCQRQRQQYEYMLAPTSRRRNSTHALFAILLFSLAAATSVLSLLQSQFLVCDAIRHSPTSKSNTSRKRTTKATGAKRSKSAAPLEIDVQAKQGTRTTGTGSHSTRNRSIFSPQHSAESTRKATVSALSGDMRPLRTASVEGRTDDGNAALYIQVKLSPNGLLFRKRIRGTDSVVSLTRTETSSSGMSGIENLDQRPIVVAQLIDINATESDSKRKPSSDSTDSSSDWIPIEGIYGIYSLPSGPHAVLITKSEDTYTSPTLRPTKDYTKPPTPPLLRFRRILSMEIVPVPATSTSKTAAKGDISLSQRKSEERQLRLLRRSFREHNLYFVPPTTDDVAHGNIVADMTHNLQRSFLAAVKVADSNRNIDSSSKDLPQRNGWWTSYVTDTSTPGKQNAPDHSLPRPDSRFFWNEQHLKPLLGPYISSIDASKGGEGNEDGPYRNPYALLLGCTFPVTSAFVGVQKKIALSSGSEKTQKESAHSVLYDEILISRRSKFRAGTRFTRRGADGTGAVTNYAETEQICFVSEQGEGRSKGDEPLQEVYSHVQTRGSIPIRWSSPADVKTYRPRVLIGTDPIAQAKALRNHLREQLSLYSIASGETSSTNATANHATQHPIKLSFVNLIDKHSDQGRLGRAFDSVLGAVLEVYANNVDASDSEDPSDTLSRDMTFPTGGINHIWFDFHAECKGGRWDRLENLLRDLAPVLDKQGYFCASSAGTRALSSTNCQLSWQVLNVQDGVVRTNCMDCLDRTNVVQSIFGRHVLHKQLHERPGLKGSATSPRKRTLPLEYAVAFRRNPMKLPWASGEVSHRLLWADNADAISRLYAGTPALKGDFTRTGKRTRRGALDDGINSLQRYYLNNFIDADRQEGMDLLAGNEEFTFIGDDSEDQGVLAADGGTKDALRNLLLFGPNNVKRDSSGSLEAGKALRQSMRSSRRSGGSSRIATGRNPLELDFNWLPGDLKGHMRSSATFAEERRSGLLKSIDARSAAAAASDLPWWVVDYSSDDEAQENATDLGTSSSGSRAENSIVPSGGHLLGALVAASQAPITTAVCIVCILWPGLLSTTTADDETDDM